MYTTVRLLQEFEDVIPAPGNAEWTEDLTFFCAKMGGVRVRLVPRSALTHDASKAVAGDLAMAAGD